MDEYIIISNRAKCLICGDVIESKSVHDYVTCSCGRLSVDGGHEYIRRSFYSEEEFVDLNEIEFEKEDK